MAGPGAEAHRGSVLSLGCLCSFLCPAHRTRAPLPETPQAPASGMAPGRPGLGRGGPGFSLWARQRPHGGWAGPALLHASYPPKQRGRLAPWCLLCRPRAASGRVLGALGGVPGQGRSAWLPLERRPGLTGRHAQRGLQQGEGELSRGGREVGCQRNPKAHAPGRPHIALPPDPPTTHRAALLMARL